jgi:hypothetical protein
MRTATIRRLRGLSLGMAALAILASSPIGDLRAEGKPPLLIRDQGNFYLRRSRRRITTPAK